MYAVQRLLEQQAQLNAAVGEQMRELKKTGILIKGVRAPTKANAEILQQLLIDLKQVNAAIKAGSEARKEAQDSHCCLRLKSSNCCGKNQEGRWTLNVLKFQGASGGNHVIEDDPSHTSRSPILPLPFEISIYAPTQPGPPDPAGRSRTGCGGPLQSSPNPSPRLAVPFWTVSLAPSLSNPSASLRALLQTPEEE